MQNCSFCALINWMLLSKLNIFNFDNFALFLPNVAKFEFAIKTNTRFPIALLRSLEC